MTVLSAGNSKKSDQIIGRGIERLNSGWIGEAKDHFLHALRLEPDNPLILKNLGISLLHLGEVSEAGQIFRQLANWYRPWTTRYPRQEE